MIDILMTSIAVAIFILLSKIGKFLGCCCIQLSEKKHTSSAIFKGVSKFACLESSSLESWLEKLFFWKVIWSNFAEVTFG